MSFLKLIFVLISIGVTHSYPPQDSPDIDFFINPGNASQLGDAPYQATLRIKAKHLPYGEVSCGGVLIDYHIVLSAAQCVFFLSGVIPLHHLQITGGNNIRNLMNGSTYVGRVERLLVHPQYDEKTLENDLALIELAQGVPKNHPTFKPIQLMTRLTPPGTRCNVSGFGFQNVTALERPLVLQVGITTIINKTVCKQMISRLAESTVCTAGGASACKGDAGGPLVCHNRLVGIVSLGSGCGQINLATAYTEIRQYYNWIKKNDGQKRVSNFWLLLVVVILRITLLK